MPGKRKGKHYVVNQFKFLIGKIYKFNLQSLDYLVLKMCEVSFGPDQSNHIKKMWYELNQIVKSFYNPSTLNYDQWVENLALRRQAELNGRRWDETAGSLLTPPLLSLFERAQIMDEAHRQAAGMKIETENEVKIDEWDKMKVIEVDFKGTYRGSGREVSEVDHLVDEW